MLLNTGGIASDAWLFTVDAAGIELLDADVSTNRTGVQVANSNGVLQVRLRAPVGGTYASVSVSSAAGDARGHVGINLMDAVPPVARANVLASAGQSRVWVSWQTNSEPDIAGYRVYYRAGTARPPWDGTAAVEGAESPVSVTGTNCLLRGLALGTNYFVAVSAVDTTGNESPLSAPLSVALTQTPPTPPTAVVARLGGDRTNVLMWALSEDDD
ncbi:MAG: fibronectin type III domain-containing protein [Verrucomicrobiota bacterium]